MTSKGQITIPVKIRQRLRLKTGDVLEFDESAAFLKATRVVASQAWESLGKQWKDTWPGKSTGQVMDDLRGPVDLPKARSRR